MTPYKPSQPNPNQLSTEALEQLFTQAYSHVPLSQEEITPEILDKAYHLAKYGPTAFNSQPARLYNLRSAESRERLAPLVSGSNKERILTAPLLLLVTADTNFHHTLTDVNPSLPDPTALFPTQLSADKSANDNSFLQAAWLIMALRAVGLAVTPMTGFKHAQVKDAFLPDHENPIMLIAAGYPDVNAPEQTRNPRRESKDVITEL